MGEPIRRNFWPALCGSLGVDVVGGRSGFGTLASSIVLAFVVATVVAMLQTYGPPRSAPKEEQR